MFRMRRNSRRLTATWLAVVMALAPITCVCADWVDAGATVAEATAALPDCHADRTAPLPDTEEHCAACGDAKPAPVTKAEAGALAPALAAINPPLVVPPRDLPAVRTATAVSERPGPTPVTLSVVLLD